MTRIFIFLYLVLFVASTAAASSSQSRQCPGGRQLEANQGTLRLISVTQADVDGTSSNGNPAKLVFNIIKGCTKINGYTINGYIKSDVVKPGAIVNVLYVVNGSTNTAVSIWSTSNIASTEPLKPSDAGGIKSIFGGNTSAQPSSPSPQREGQLADAMAPPTQQTHNPLDSPSGVVSNLENDKSLADVRVTFGFDTAVLTSENRKNLDALASRLSTMPGYVLQVTGYTDSTGDAIYLSQQRVSEVVKYLSTKHGIPLHKFSLAGIDKDSSAAGRTNNGRVEIQLLASSSDKH
jgi:OOP family OmpA-OmpF porin